jgi:hypothetical protein
MLDKTARANSCVELAEIRRLDCLLQQCAAAANLVFISCDDLTAHKRNKLSTINVIRRGPDQVETTQSFTDFLEEFQRKTVARATTLNIADKMEQLEQSVEPQPAVKNRAKSPVSTFPWKNQRDHENFQTKSCSNLNLLSEFCDVDDSTDNMTDNNECETNFSCSENILNRQAAGHAFIKNDNINRGYRKMNYSSKVAGGGGAINNNNYFNNNNNKPTNKKILKKLCSCQIYEKPDYICDKSFMINSDDDPFSDFPTSSSLRPLPMPPPTSLVKTSFAQNNKLKPEKEERSVNIIEVPTQEIIVEAIARPADKSLTKSLSRAKFSPFLLRKQSSRMGDDFTSETAKEAALLAHKLDKKILEPVETVC